MIMPSNREPGAPMESGIPLCIPNVCGNEWAYVKSCLDGGWVSSVGAFVGRFETEFATATGSAAAVATSSGTAALHIALLVAGVLPGDEVIMPSLTFVAPANAVRYTGAWPVFVDVDPHYWQLDPASVLNFLEEDCDRVDGVVRNRHTGRRVSAILTVDILGHPSDLDALSAIATAWDLQLVEDATESLGALYKARRLGGISRLTAFSFNGNKLLTTGGGGMLATTNVEMARRARYLTTQAKDEPIEFVHGEVGYNYRLTNVQAAIGVAQLEQLNTFVDRKREIARQYSAAFSPVEGLTEMREAPWARSAFWLYTVRIDASVLKTDWRNLLPKLEALGVQTRPLWQPLHKSPAHAQSYSRPCPVSTRLQSECLNLPSSTSLTSADQQTVISKLLGLLKVV